MSIDKNGEHESHYDEDDNAGDHNTGNGAHAERAQVRAVPAVVEAVALQLCVDAEVVAAHKFVIVARSCVDNDIDVTMEMIMVLIQGRKEGRKDIVNDALNTIVYTVIWCQTYGLGPLT